ncbi:AGE family epimerase/isomerase [Actinoplanes sp. NEAU-A12]|uniref:AGE family epimerase/isomerase n=1 Tax=Actinoplanes sandaracinus TaxID=3045177 RepID=A0ABT6WL24_9ACTN|nr:AGE family epimerase/isomerase [Actinoplanes sandaracinus]MDI6100429.1 AGE family epimerase/isomerase [Actinoplanes sandaracinus]
MDTIAGYVTSYDEDRGVFEMSTRAGDTYTVHITKDCSAELLRNLDEPYVDACSHLPQMLTAGTHLFVYGVFYPEGDGYTFEAKRMVFLGRQPGDYNFEKHGWWINQLDSLAGFYRKAQFGAGPVDYRQYRTNIRLGGERTDSHVQETDTISRMVYGMASAYMLTGRDEYLEIAEKGTQYLRDHMRFVDSDNDIVYWYHGIKVEGDYETKLFTSEFDDDYDAIPMYEQIYALAGPTQTFRITGDRRISSDIDHTMRLFENHFRDVEGGGYFSHIDPVLLSPDHESLKFNRARKNWNSVGDHAPAYLINAYLATGEEKYREMLERTFDTIVKYFPDYENSPFVNERFFTDWSHDLEHTWQGNRAVVGHNLKIAWNLMRMNSVTPKDDYKALAEKIGAIMPPVGSDQQRGGWYDVVERFKQPGQEWHRFAWHDRKAWWQQEQAILAYLILAGTVGGDANLEEARQAAAFYNTFFLDHDEGAVYFNVLASGMPYLLGTERLKGSHSMSMYHSAELCFLATVYTSLLITKQPLDLYFKPRPDASRLLRVAPDMLPPGSFRLEKVEIDGKPYEVFDAQNATVELPASTESLSVKVQLVPVS